MSTAVSDAYLVGTDFSGANLNQAKMSGTYFRRPGGAHRRYAEQLRATGLPDGRIEQATRGEAKLANACLAGADLSGARGVTNEQIAKQTSSLAGATMPDGQKYEDWLKVREGSREEIENPGPS